MSIISNSAYPPEITNVGGEFMVVFLIIALIMSLLLTDTKYWNKYISNMFDINSSSLLLMFIMIVVFRVMITI